MTLKVLKSLAPDDFAQSVDAHIAELKAWVSSVDVPRPTASPYVEAAVKRIRSDGPDDFEPDFEIVDDSPGEDEQKRAAINDMRVKEAAEVAKLVPFGKTRLLQMDAAAAASVPERNRTPEHEAAIAAYVAFKEGERKIQHEAAQREAEIEDAATHEERIAIVAREFSK